MANFRRNHAGGGLGASSMLRSVMLLIVLGGILFALFMGGARLIPGLTGEGERQSSYSGPDAWYYPAVGRGHLLEKQHFALSYREDREQAEWVAYILDREQVTPPWVKRKDWYAEDPAIPTGSATWADYRGSGFDRGHLIPAADRAFSREAMDETFLMSNISPQRHGFNAGIWRELEELVREWVKRDGRLYVVSGPLFGEDPTRIGKNAVAVPEAFFKVLLDLGEPEVKGIGFIIPNAVSYEPVSTYAVSIDAVEAASELDLFPDLMTDTFEAEMESRYDPGLWPEDPAKFKRRIESWNKDRN